MQRAGPEYVRFGSEADIEARRPDVCFTPESGHRENLYSGTANAAKPLAK
jgi:hypothetical protein